MKKSGNEFQTPLARARGWGSAKSGVHHFLVERLTGLALVPLGLWFVVSLLSCLLDGRVATLVSWLDSPINAGLMALLIVMGFLHSSGGVQVVIEDYVKCSMARPALLLVNKTLHILLGLLSLMAIFNLHFMHSVAV